MYILHFLFVGLVFRLLGPPGSGASALLFFLLATGATMAGALVTNVLIESYFIRWGHRLTRRTEVSESG